MRGENPRRGTCSAWRRTYEMPVRHCAPCVAHDEGASGEDQSGTLPLRQCDAEQVRLMSAFLPRRLFVLTKKRSEEKRRK